MFVSNRIPLPRSGVVKGFAVGVMVGTVVVASAAVARADDTRAEADYAATYHSAICVTLDEFHSEAGVVGVLREIVADGFTAYQAVEIVNAAVNVYCPRNWPMLVNIGNASRSSAVA